MEDLWSWEGTKNGIYYVPLATASSSIMLALYINICYGILEWDVYRLELKIGEK
ncbi:hypothetical protein SESBI_16616, partial [Sesbania bispinosa]